MTWLFFDECGVRPVERVPYGKEDHHGGDPMFSECPSCGVRVGNVHVDACEREQCPDCGDRFASCECFAVPLPVRITGNRVARMSRFALRPVPDRDRGPGGFGGSRERTRPPDPVPVRFPPQYRNG